ncbi:hypothetical protein HNY73_012704 [Argiope bruennichi]|uniref:Uncharacterized protein n=1 Tax=Argiope bruennichi TaxID=94029 RepID=A0A8T0EXK7_ARGBR|nr:hypothetical protein HNY73_012704 [Argiope bruennichi]
MKLLVVLSFFCLVCSCLAGYRNFNQYFPSSYISRYAYGNKYHVPGTYNYGYPQRYASAERSNVYDYALTTYPQGLGIEHYIQ